MKSPFQRIIGINLAILLAVAVVLRLLYRGPDSGLGYMFMMALAIALQLLMNLIAAFGAHKENRQAHWLSVLLVLLIGFGACVAGASFHL